MNQVGIYCYSTTDQSKSPGVQQSNLPNDEGSGDGRDAVSRLEGVRPGPSSQEGNKTPEQGARPVKSSPLLRPGDHLAYTPQGHVVSSPGFPFPAAGGRPSETE
jgi:hypothetical protein